MLVPTAVAALTCALRAILDTIPSPSATNRALPSAPHALRSAGVSGTFAPARASLIACCAPFVARHPCPAECDGVGSVPRQGLDSPPLASGKLSLRTTPLAAFPPPGCSSVPVPGHPPGSGPLGAVPSLRLPPPAMWLPRLLNPTTTSGSWDVWANGAAGAPGRPGVGEVRGGPLGCTRCFARTCIFTCSLRSAPSAWMCGCRSSWVQSALATLIMNDYFVLPHSHPSPRCSACTRWPGAARPAKAPRP